MYRLHVRCEVLYGHYAEFIQNIEECNAVARKRGWVEFTPWTPTSGKLNEVVLIGDYPDYATYKQEEVASESDPEFMKAWRQGSNVMVQGSGSSELLEPAHHLA